MNEGEVRERGGKEEWRAVERERGKKGRGRDVEGRYGRCVEAAGRRGIVRGARADFGEGPGMWGHAAGSVAVLLLAARRPLPV